MSDKEFFIHRHVKDEVLAKWLAKLEQRKGKWVEVHVEQGFPDTWHVIGTEKEKP